MVEIWKALTFFVAWSADDAETGFLVSQQTHAFLTCGLDTIQVWQVQLLPVFMNLDKSLSSLLSFFSFSPPLTTPFSTSLTSSFLVSSSDLGLPKTNPPKGLAPELSTGLLLLLPNTNPKDGFVSLAAELSVAAKPFVAAEPSTAGLEFRKLKAFSAGLELRKLKAFSSGLLLAVDEKANPVI